MSLQNIGYGKNAPEEIHVIIEIPAHSPPIKYEIDKETGALFVDRFMSAAMRYPCDYGYVPQTLSEDGDPIDVLVICPIPLTPGCVIRCRPIGMLAMTDESGKDTKILAVPVDKLTPLYRHVQQAEDLPGLLLEQIKHFFEHYKDLEKNKWVKVDSWCDADTARKEIAHSIERYAQSGNE